MSLYTVNSSSGPIASCKSTPEYLLYTLSNDFNTDLETAIQNPGD